MIKSYKVRIYPTKEQEALMWKHIGSCRFIWNWMLAKQQEIREPEQVYSLKREAVALRCCCTFKLWSIIQTRVASAKWDAVKQ